MIDLHVHSTASDGAIPPRQILWEAHKAGLSAIALTDHDTVDGLPDFLASASPGLPKPVPGIELACGHVEYGEAHIIGLFLKFLSPLKKTLQLIRAWRQERNLRMIAKLNSLGMELTEQDVRLEMKDPSGVMGRPHIAGAMIRRGYCRSAEEAFSQWLRRDRPGYVPRQKLTTKEGFDLIHEAGGIAVWAHPMARNASNAKVENCLRQMKEDGLDAVETLYPDHTPRNTEVLTELAEKYQLACSGGSDFHGGTAHTHILLGHGYGGEWHVPDRFLTILEQRIPSRQEDSGKKPAEVSEK